MAATPLETAVAAAEDTLSQARVACPAARDPSTFRLAAAVPAASTSPTPTTYGPSGGFGMPGMPGGKSGRGGRFAGGRRAPEPEVTVVEKTLAVSLEELFNGATKKLKIKRKTYDSGTGKQSTQDRILEVPIKKGLKAGSKIKFSDVGDQVEGGTQDLHFIVSEVSASVPFRTH
jgi:DnaJ-class molecular chaperone